MDKKIYITFDDVLIKPAASNIEPRQSNTGMSVIRGVPFLVPVLSAAMDTVTDDRMAIAMAKVGGIGVIHRNCTVEQQCEMVEGVVSQGLIVGAACGPFDQERALALDKIGVTAIFIDCAHGHNQKVIESAKRIKNKLTNAKLVVGNIVTKDGARDLVSFVDAIKVGVGPGSICTTRVISGVGMPQLSAIMDVAQVAQEHGIPVIADGGIKEYGDIVKALAAGASGVMLGGMLARCEESPGKRIECTDGSIHKVYRGMGSRQVLEQGKSSDRYLNKNLAIVPEGVSGIVPVEGTVKEIISEVQSALQIGMGYVGARDIQELWGRAQFIRISSLSQKENNHHNIHVNT